MQRLGDTTIERQALSRFCYHPVHVTQLPLALVRVNGTGRPSGVAINNTLLLFPNNTAGDFLVFRRTLAVAMECFVRSTQDAMFCMQYCLYDYIMCNEAGSAWGIITRLLRLSVLTVMLLVVPMKAEHSPSCLYPLVVVS